MSAGGMMCWVEDAFQEAFARGAGLRRPGGGRGLQLASRDDPSWDRPPAPRSVRWSGRWSRVWPSGVAALRTAPSVAW